MNKWAVNLQVTQSQQETLLALCSAFARACNELAGTVQKTKCWNRVALHHMTYRQLRQTFPNLGSQMVCNVIYSVCRNARLVYQHPESPYHINKLDGKPLPRMYFNQHSAVFFDKHTLSISRNRLSLYTLEGRMKFEINIPEDVEKKFRSESVKEISLEYKKNQQVILRFVFDEASNDSKQPKVSDLSTYQAVRHERSLPGSMGEAA